MLASGSKGNCSVVEDPTTNTFIVVDCGISWKAFRERSLDQGIDLSRIAAILITHEHSDHTKGLGVTTRGLAKLGVTPSLYASSLVHAASSEIRAIENAVDLRHFNQGDEMHFGNTTVYAFRTSHDAAESFGFRFTQGNDTLGFMTDTGVATPESIEALANCRILAIEANHDADMLAHGPYPAYLKSRIASAQGHLSNEQSAQLLDSLLCDKLETVVGMHVSQNNNTYRYPKDVLGETLARNCHSASALVGYQDRPISL